MWPQNQWYVFSMNYLFYFSYLTGSFISNQLLPDGRQLLTFLFLLPWLSFIGSVYLENMLIWPIFKSSGVLHVCPLAAGLVKNNVAQQLMSIFHIYFVFLTYSMVTIIFQVLHLIFIKNKKLFATEQCNLFSVKIAKARTLQTTKNRRKGRSSVWRKRKRSKKKGKRRKMK